MSHTPRTSHHSTNTRPSARSLSNRASLSPEVRDLLALPFPAFALAVAALLERMGYADVRLVKAMHGRGRNVHGGYDLTARLPGDPARGLVLVQLKQYEQPVPRIYVDEIRGAMLRLRAAQGLLVATSTFSPAAAEAVQAAQHAAAVYLIDGEELADLLRRHPAGRPPVLPTLIYRGAAFRPLTRSEADRMEREFLMRPEAPGVPRSTAAGMPSAGHVPSHHNLALAVSVRVTVTPVIQGLGGPRREETP